MLPAASPCPQPRNNSTEANCLLSTCGNFGIFNPCYEQPTPLRPEEEVCPLKCLGEFGLIKVKAFSGAPPTAKHIASGGGMGGVGVQPLFHVGLSLFQIT